MNILNHKRVYYFEENNLKIRPVLARYKFPLPFIKGKIVLDLGCGARSGPSILAETASRVVGTDISSEAISYCSKNWPKSNIAYMVADAVNLPFSDQSFDVVVSFEVIEHVLDYHKYLSEILRVLKRDGIFILSTPNRRVASPNGILSNPDHCREFDPDEFKDVLAKQFTSVALYGQRPSNRAQKAEDSLKQAQERSAKAPSILKLVLPKKLKKMIFEIYMSFWAKIRTLPNPNGITEDDFVIEKDKTEDAVNLLAVCAK